MPLPQAKWFPPLQGQPAHLRPLQARDDGGAGAPQRRGHPEPRPRGDTRAGSLRREGLQPRRDRQARRNPHQRQEKAPGASSPRRPADPRRRRALVQHVRRAAEGLALRRGGRRPRLDQRDAAARDQPAARRPAQALRVQREADDDEGDRPAARVDARRRHRGHGGGEGPHPPERRRFHDGPARGPQGRGRGEPALGRTPLDAPRPASARRATSSARPSPRRAGRSATASCAR